MTVTFYCIRDRIKRTFPQIQSVILSAYMREIFVDPVGGLVGERVPRTWSPELESVLKLQLKL